MATAPKSVRIVAELDPALAARLRAYCDEARRSRASAIRFLIARGLRQYELEAGDDR